MTLAALRATVANLEQQVQHLNAMQQQALEENRQQREVTQEILKQMQDERQCDRDDRRELAELFRQDEEQSRIANNNERGRASSGRKEAAAERSGPPATRRARKAQLVRVDGDLVQLSLFICATEVNPLRLRRETSVYKSSLQKSCSLAVAFHYLHNWRHFY